MSADPFARDYIGEPFHLFGLPHLIAIGLVVLVCAAFFIPQRRPHLRLRAAFRYGLAAVLVANEVAGHIWYWRTDQWSVTFALPFHLCSAFVWISAIMLLTRSYRVYEFCYFLGIGGALQALLTPNLSAYGFPHFRFFQAFIMHGAIIIAGVYMTVVEGYRPHWRSFLRVAVGANIYMGIVGGINLLLGSDYLFICHGPGTPSLLDYLGPWPWYILSMEAVGAVVCLILYLPFAIRDGWAGRAGRRAERLANPHHPPRTTSGK